MVFLSKGRSWRLPRWCRSHLSKVWLQKGRHGWSIPCKSGQLRRADQKVQHRTSASWRRSSIRSQRKRILRSSKQEWSMDSHRSGSRRLPDPSVRNLSSILLPWRGTRNCFLATLSRRCSIYDQVSQECRSKSLYWYQPRTCPLIHSNDLFMSFFKRGYENGECLSIMWWKSHSYDIQFKKQLK